MKYIINSAKEVCVSRDTGYFGYFIKTVIALSAAMLLLYTPAANATSYNIPGYKVIVLPAAAGTEGRPFNQAWGLNSKGQIAGSHGPAQYMYDLKTGQYTYYDDIRPINIDNTGRMIGGCDIRDVNGNITTVPAPPPLAVHGYDCRGGFNGIVFAQGGIRGIAEKGLVTGYYRTVDISVNPWIETWSSYIYNPNTGIFNYFETNPLRSLTGNITNEGVTVGTTLLSGGTSIFDRAAYVREADGTIKTFRAINDDAFPPLTNARGISENGKLITGFYTSLPDFFVKAFVMESKDLGPANTDVVVNVLDITTCNPDGPEPPEGYDVTLADSNAYEVRNNGVVLVNCDDYHVNTSDGDFEFAGAYVLVAIPDHLDESTLWED